VTILVTNNFYLVNWYWNWSL